tara:strand:- start:46 stop:204 length:159 start_codon:yes stop_codon:yes gene_type:complete
MDLANGIKNSGNQPEFFHQLGRVVYILAIYIHLTTFVMTEEKSSKKFTNRQH